MLRVVKDVAGGLRRAGVLAVLMWSLCVLAAACAPATATGGSGGQLRVVAAENFWGSLVTQLGGSRVSVTSVVTDPNTDPHDYQSSASTARSFAIAQYVVVNGAGYDGWAKSLLDANPTNGRTVFTVADLLGKHDGDNPHFWYSPAYVTRVADRITRDLSAIDGADAAYFRDQHAAFATALQPYENRVAEIKRQFAGRRIASTESIFVYMAGALGLDLISPPEFMKAVAEGNDPPASSVEVFRQQLRTREATVLVYNKQTETDLTSTMQQLATQQHIPIVGVYETLQPPGVTFQGWMVAELTAVESALAETRAAP